MVLLVRLQLFPLWDSARVYVNDGDIVMSEFEPNARFFFGLLKFVFFRVKQRVLQCASCLFETL